MSLQPSSPRSRRLTSKFRIAQLMSTCPHCHQHIDAQAVSCPYCKATLKAFGHPGIPLHQAEKDTFLCDSCTYHEDDTCTYPQRPYAKTCTLYQNRFERTKQEIVSPRYQPGGTGIKAMLQKNQGVLLLLSLLAIALFLAL